MLLSIIIPVYNGEKHIAECLQSLVRQLTPACEVIIIDDGSTDNTTQIIRENLSHSSLPVKYIKTENQGVSAARNLGLQRSTGTYIAFVDADDIVDDIYIETIIRATEQSPDIIEIGYKHVNASGQIVSGNYFLHRKFGHHPASTVSRLAFASGIWYPCLRISKRKLFKKVEFPLGVRFCEDVMTIPLIYERASTITSLPAALYLYRQNPAGATQNAKPDYAAHLAKFYRSIDIADQFCGAALKICTAYALRRCTRMTIDRTATLPDDIQSDIKRVAREHPSLVWRSRTRFWLYAIFGKEIYRIKDTLRQQRS